MAHEHNENEVQDAAFTALDANPDAIISQDDYVPEGEGPEYEQYLRDTIDFLAARGLDGVASHFRTRLELAEHGFTLARAQTLMM